MAEGKKVITSGPWQMIDIPTKVSNRRCNYLTGLLVTVRQKDPARRPASSSAPTISDGNGVKTRLNQQQDSRGSSRASSRASSPVSLQPGDNGLASTNGVNGHTKHLRSNKTRANKLKKSTTQPANNKVNSVPAKTNGTTTTCSTPPEKESTAPGSSSKSIEPCVTYSLDVDGVPHFRVFLPPKDSSKAVALSAVAPSIIPSPAAAAPVQHKVPHASIVESDIEVDLSDPSSPAYKSWVNSHKRPGRMYPSNWTPSVASVKPIKRPRIVQGPSPSKPGSGGSNGSLDLSLSASVSSGNTDKDASSCIEKCGSWMGAPHFKIYRTIPPANPAASDSRPVAPKLSSPKAAAAAAGLQVKTSSVPPKLTMAGHLSPIGAGMNNNNGRIVPTVVSKSGGKPETGQPLMDRTPPSAGIKRPASVLKSCPPLFSTTSGSSPSSSPVSPSFLTVKNFKDNNDKVIESDIFLLRFIRTLDGLKFFFTGPAECSSSRRWPADKKSQGDEGD